MSRDANAIIMYMSLFHQSTVAVAWKKTNVIYSKTDKKENKLNYTFTWKSVNLLSNLVTRFRRKSFGISNAITSVVVRSIISPH